MNRQILFSKHLAQTTMHPLGIEITKAKGSYLWSNKKKFIDLIGGISVCNIGHANSRVIEAINRQIRSYSHVMVYGECLLSPQVEYAKLITDYLPSRLDTVYFTNSGSEAIEGAIKLVRKLSKKKNIIAFKDAYHGSTNGALSLIGDDYWKKNFEPLLPNIKRAIYNSEKAIQAIDKDTAAVFLEAVQAESGVTMPDKKWIKQLSKKCKETKTLLVIDENQSAFGRTGKLFAYEHFDIVPDILVLGKALGGGLPLGAFVSSKENMLALTENPILGHITTFGGNPVSCVAGKVTFDIVLKKDLRRKVEEKRDLFLSLLKHKNIVSVSHAGLWIAIELKNKTKCLEVVHKAINKGVFIDWFLFAPNKIRICPSLRISKRTIKEACKILLSCL